MINSALDKIIESKEMTIPYDKCGKKFKSNYEGRKKFFKDLFEVKGTCYKNLSELEHVIEKFYTNKTKTLNKKYSLCDCIVNTLYNKNINVDECQQLLNKLLKKDPDIIKSSQFKKAACYMWYVKYEQ